jgi:hypothetical protein
MQRIEDVRRLIAEMPPAEREGGTQTEVYMEELGRMVEPGGTLAVRLREDREQHLGMWPRPDEPRGATARDQNLDARAKFMRVHANPQMVHTAQTAHRAFTG